MKLLLPACSLLAFLGFASAWGLVFPYGFFAMHSLLGRISILCSQSRVTSSLICCGFDDYWVHMHRVFNCRGSQSCWVWVCLLLLNRKLSTVVSPVIHRYSMICVPLHPQGVFTTSEVMMLSAVFMNIIFLSI